MTSGCCTTTINWWSLVLHKINILACMKLVYCQYCDNDIKFLYCYIATCMNVDKTNVFLYSMTFVSRNSRLLSFHEICFTENSRGSALVLFWCKAIHFNSLFNSHKVAIGIEKLFEIIEINWIIFSTWIWCS